MVPPYCNFTDCDDMGIKMKAVLSFYGASCEMVDEQPTEELCCAHHHQPEHKDQYNNVLKQ